MTNRRKQRERAGVFTEDRKGHEGKNECLGRGKRTDPAGLPRLKEMLERETDPQRRALIAHAITYISESTDGGDAR